VVIKNIEKRQKGNQYQECKCDHPVEGEECKKLNLILTAKMSMQFTHSHMGLEGNIEVSKNGRKGDSHKLAQIHCRERKRERRNFLIRNSVGTLG